MAKTAKASRPSYIASRCQVQHGTRYERKRAGSEDTLACCFHRSHARRDENELEPVHPFQHAVPVFEDLVFPGKRGRRANGAVSILVCGRRWDATTTGVSVVDWL